MQTKRGFLYMYYTHGVAGHEENGWHVYGMFPTRELASRQMYTDTKGEGQSQSVKDSGVVLTWDWANGLRQVACLGWTGYMSPMIDGNYPDKKGLIRLAQEEFGSEDNVDEMS